MGSHVSSPIPYHNIRDPFAMSPGTGEVLGKPRLFDEEKIFVRLIILLRRITFKYSRSGRI